MIANLKRVGAVAALVLVHTTSGAAQTDAGSPPPFPPPGRLVDVGGWRLHLNCTGQKRPGQPTVILEAGIGDFSVEWSLVQPGVAAFARVCSYDRANNGWSDMGPRPRTIHQVVYELHTLLDSAGERPPYVLVGHSYGGWPARLYAINYPADVKGMVLVDAGKDDPVRVLSDGVLRHSSDLVTGKPLPPVKTANPLRESDIPAGILSQLKSAAAQFGPRANEAPRNKLPADAQRMRTWALWQVKHWAQNDNPFEADELEVLRAQRKKSEHPFGDMPLVVLVRGISDAEGPDGKAMADKHRRELEGVARMSRKGKLVVAANSGHHIQIDEPRVVVDAVREVVAAARQ